MLTDLKLYSHFSLDRQTLQDYLKETIFLRHNFKEFFGFQNTFTPISRPFPCKYLVTTQDFHNWLKYGCYEECGALIQPLPFLSPSPSPTVPLRRLQLPEWFTNVFSYSNFYSLLRIVEQSILITL